MFPLSESISSSSHAASAVSSPIPSTVTSSAANSEWVCGIVDDSKLVHCLCSGCGSEVAARLGTDLLKNVVSLGWFCIGISLGSCYWKDFARISAFFRRCSGTQSGSRSMSSIFNIAANNCPSSQSSSESSTFDSVSESDVSSSEKLGFKLSKNRCRGGSSSTDSSGLGARNLDFKALTSFSELSWSDNGVLRLGLFEQRAMSS
ncbi:hypothetical protein EV424DRAFT_1410592 [Suillus variegatus]|nr:hypothetical protein EV424DRAFT_1447972 [Suillus variegatus]KAG1800719.1 hypothetical protein EV424DRAFT_1437528 [Suillus variegatus]KAG1816249.1 hypothetical protein EV424DRAFT_1410592 [Suillus variegatus]